ncbi:MAG: peptide ABC transporter substrate-binding protein [Burkholderiales bacterium]|nr:peptide ABC transporter substrate-binding protein [Opitutaceae bacterium]
MSPGFFSTILPLVSRLGAAAALVCALAGCGPRETVVERGNRDRVLYRGNATEPESLDPYLVRGQVEWTIVGGLFEGLVTPDAATMEARPGVAERWDISPDGLTYTFHLRAGAQWSDGAPVTAADFFYGARRMLAPRLASAHPENNLFFVKGARNFQNGKTTDFSTVGVAAPDERTVVFTLERPTPFFLSALYLFFPVRQAAVEAHGAMDDRANGWTRPGNLVGNGPFTLAEWSFGQRIVLAKNARYWDAANVGLEGIHFLPIENAQVEETSFRTGQLHLTSTVPFSKIETYLAQADSPLRQVDDRGVYFYTVNVNKAPLNDKRVRKALAMAVDREQLARAVLKGGRQPATSFTPSGMGGYTSRAHTNFDPERARALLAEAGYPGGEGMPPVELLFDSREYHRIIAEAVQQMWRQHLNVQVTLRNEETQVLIATKNRMDFHLARGSWNATTYQDPFYFLGAWQTGALYNEAGWANAEFDACIAATWTADAAAREAAFQRAEEIFLEETPAIPLFFSTQMYLASPKVKGLLPKPFADRRLKVLSLEE